MSSSLLQKLKQREPASKREVEQLLLELADSDDLRFRLSSLIAHINSHEQDPQYPTIQTLAQTLRIPAVPRDWEEAQEPAMHAAIAHFRSTNLDGLTVDFCDPLMWSSVTAWNSLKYALVCRAASGGFPRLLLPKSLEFINTKLAAVPTGRAAKPKPSDPGDVADLLPSIRIALMRWRLYHKQGALPPRITSEDERQIARDFGKRLGDGDEATIARQVLEGEFRKWLVQELLPRL